MASPEGREGGLLRVLGLESIRNRILVLALLATLIPAVSTAMLSFQRTRRALTETLEAELQRAGTQTARELDLWEKERAYDLRVFGGSFEVTENLPRVAGGGMAATEARSSVANYLALIQSRFPDYGGFEVTDGRGTTVASSRTDGTTTELRPEWLPNLERGEAVFGDPYMDASLGVVSTIAVPVQSADARFLGALVATLGFSTVEADLEDFAPGDAGRIEILTAEGRRVASSSSGTGLEPALPPGTLATLASASGAMIEYEDVDGAQMVGLLTPLDRRGWSALVQLPTDEAYARIAQLRRTTTLLVSVLLLFVGAAAYFIGLLIVRPLDHLTAGATAVAGGDLSVDLPVSGHDEVAMLTRVFNGMVAELRSSRRELDEANDTLRAQYAELQEISIRDSLTELYDRRYVLGELERELGRAERHERRLAVLMIDVDRFKQYNDAWGHQAGDDVLRGMGAVLGDATREADVPGRYGGEEFIVLLPDCDIAGALATGERIRARLDQEVFEGRKVTASIGAAEYPTHGDTPRDLIGAADVALYQAKEQGRDRVVAAGAPAGGGRAKEDPAAKRRPAAKKKSPAKKKAPKKKS